MNMLFIVILFISGATSNTGATTLGTTYSVPLSNNKSTHSGLCLSSTMM